MGLRKIEEYPLYSYEEYKLWEGKWELIEGAPYAMAPAPMIAHQNISTNIAWQLKEIFQECQKCQTLLPIDWKIAEDTIVQPDNLVICHKPTHPAYITQAPSIIFEILSKSTAHKDEGIKFDLYEREGVYYYIIINPSDQVAKIYHLQNGKYVKLKDTHDESICFTLKSCNKELSFDFSKVW